MWTPITERRPERNSQVLYWYVDIYGHGYWRMADEWRDEHHLAGVTHWILLTEPVQEKEK